MKSSYYCQECGYESAKWLGRCPGCEKWNTLVEEIRSSPGPLPSFAKTPSKYQPFPSIKASDKERLTTSFNEFDRVLGGGLVKGSLVLVGGDPGIGKSTLLLQIANSLASSSGPILYTSGEESCHQVKLRGDRLKVNSPALYILSEVNLENIFASIEKLSPKVLIVDSIQTIYRPDFGGSPGGVGQVRECTTALMYLAKSSDLSIFIVGHVTKEGAIAGPKVLEHIVDTVLYLEGEESHSYRILRAVKNRFGSTNEIGVFEMESDGLKEVPDPSAKFLAERVANIPGSVVVASIEGTRPILVEIQALVSSTNFSLAKREVLGVDSNRVALLIAVLEKKIGLHLGGCDIFVNVAGGVKILEPAADLGIALSIISNFKNVPLSPEIAVVGEIGLTGEVRTVSFIEKRIEEVRKLGFKRCIIPENNLLNLKKKEIGIELTGVKTVKEALEKGYL